MNSIFHRISVRKYEDKPIEKEKTEQLLRAAMAAPSAGNQQPWEFYVVEDRETMEKLAACSPYVGCLKDAPAAIVAVYRKKCMMPEYAEIDLSIAMENMWLMADEIGLGGVWLGIAPLAERMEAVARVLDLPEDLIAFGIFAYGYPAEERPQQDRYEESRVHWWKQKS